MPIITALAGLLLLTAAVIGQTPRPAVNTADRAAPIVAADRGRALEEILTRQARGRFWGAVAVVEDGRPVLVKGYGDAGGGRGPVGPDSLFDVGSVAKQFTAAGVLRLIEQGRLRLDQPINQVFDGVPRDKAGITIHHLLTHTSGLPLDVDADRPSGLDRDKMVARVMRGRMTARPGEKFEYNNVGYFLLAAAVERASGQAFENHLAEHVFAPAGMPATHFVSEDPGNDPRDTARRSQALRGRDSTAAHYAWTWWFKGATGVVTTAEDLVRWDSALRGDAVLDAASRRTMFAGGPHRYGTGWMIEHGGTEHARAVHGGATPGYRCFIIRHLDRPAMVAVLTNEEHDAEGLARALMQEIAPAPVEAGVWTRAYLRGFKPDRSGAYHGSPPDEKGEGAEWLVLPRYEGVDEHGQAIRDERTTLVILDPQAPGRWMMVSRIADEAVGVLIKELESAIAVRRATRRSREPEGLEVEFRISPWKLSGHMTVDYPTEARWHAIAGPQAPAKLTPERAETGDQRIGVYLEDPRSRKLAVVARMDVGTAERLLAELKKHGPAARREAEQPMARPATVASTPASLGSRRLSVYHRP